MFKRFGKWFKKESNAKLERQKIVKNWISGFGIDWCDIENLLFWENTRVSLAVYIIFTLFLWKFIIYKLQRLAILVVVTCISTLFRDVRENVKQFMTEKLQIAVREENRQLGFDLDDVSELIVDIWLQAEEHYEYLKQLKNTSNPKLLLHLLAYFSVLIVIMKYVPIANVLFVQGTFLYFLPILSYLGVLDKIVEKLDKLVRPVASHWTHNKTKRRRNRLRKLGRLNSPKTLSSDTDDIENEQFLPEANKHNHKVLTSMHQDDSFNDSFDEFDLRGQLHHGVEDENSSDYDEASFLPPSYDYRLNQAMPSLSQFDSMMEPLEDEFHAGLDFKNVSATSTGNFGLPSGYCQDHYTANDDDGQATDNDVEDIPIEQTDGVRFARMVKNNTDSSDYKERGLKRTLENDDDVDETSYRDRLEYEFLDRTELNNVTDEEINEQAIGQSPSSFAISKGVSTFLGH